MLPIRPPSYAVSIEVSAGMPSRIKVEGFKSIRELDLQLRPLNLMIGANGSGKSNLVAVFGLLNEIIQGHLQVAVRKAGGAASLLHHGPKTTRSIRLSFYEGLNGYVVRLGIARDSLFFEEEACFFQGSGYATPYEIPVGNGHDETRLPEVATREPVARHVLDRLGSWKVYHFHDTSPNAAVKLTGHLNDNAMLRADASNLAAFLYRLRRSAVIADGHAYKRIVAAVRLVAPFFDDFQLRPDPLAPDKIQLEWLEKDSDAYFNAHSLSDGTLRFICLAALLLQPELPSMVLIDEPELGLHPYAVVQLASMLKAASKKTTLLVATQSATLVNQFDPDQVLVVDREAGQSTFRHIPPEKVEGWLDEYSLGDLWEKNLVGGRPQSS